MDPRGAVRDWNEEYQSCRDLVIADPQQHAMRARTLHRIYVEFVEAAARAACAIVDGDILPLNPNEPERSQIYLYNNIFLNFAFDSRDIYDDCGGDATAHRMMKHDVRGHAALRYSASLPSVISVFPNEI